MGARGHSMNFIHCGSAYQGIQVQGKFIETWSLFNFQLRHFKHLGNILRVVISHADVALLLIGSGIDMTSIPIGIAGSKARVHLVPASAPVRTCLSSFHPTDLKV